MPVYKLEDSKTRAFEGYLIAGSIQEARKQTSYSVSFYASSFTAKDVELEAQRRLLCGVEIKGVRVSPTAPNYLALNILARRFERSDVPVGGLVCQLGGRASVRFSSGEEVAQAVADLDNFYCLINRKADEMKSKRPIPIPEEAARWRD